MLVTHDPKRTFSDRTDFTVLHMILTMGVEGADYERHLAR